MSNENINIADILRDCPKGMKLYSSVYGTVFFNYIDYSVVVAYNREEGQLDVNHRFLSDGRALRCKDAECVLFPSREMRDWSKFFKRGDLVYNPHSQMYAIFSDWVDDTYTEFNTTLCWEKNDNSVSEEQVCATGCFESIKGQEGNIIQKFEEHYHGKYNPDTLRVEPVKHECPFKPFDKVLVRDTDTDKWDISLFSHYREEGNWYYYTVGSFYEQCIPYNDHTAHLLDTSDPYEEGGAE